MSQEEKNSNANAENEGKNTNFDEEMVRQETRIPATNQGGKE